MSNADVGVFAASKGLTLRFNSGAMSLYSKQIDGTFPDVDRILSQCGGERVFRTNRDEVLAAIDQVMAIADPRSVAVKFSERDGKMRLSARNHSVGWCEISTGGSFPDAYEFGLNANYARGILKACSRDVTFKASDGASPILVQDADKSMDRVVMPMRV